MNQNYIAVLGKLILVAASTSAIAFPISETFAAESVPSANEVTLQNPQLQQLLVADKDDYDDEKKIRVKLPKKVKSAVFQDISQRTQVEYSALRLLRAEKTTWVDGCLGLKGNCSKGLVPGYIVVVASDSQMWIYRTDKSGEIAKLDEKSTQTYTAMMAKRQTVISQVNRRVERRSRVLSASTNSRSNQAVTVNTMAARNTHQMRQSSQTAIKRKSGIGIAIYQPAGNFSQVIARISVKTKRGKKGFYKERFLGDYKYKIKKKQKAKFVKGIKTGDRMVIRLYDTQNRFIGYSEFEYLTANTAVNLILPSNPAQNQIVRTVYGIDSDFDGNIDAGSNTYSYFTQVSNGRVSFLSSSSNINVSEFQMQGISTASSSVYSASFSQGEYALANRSIKAFSSDSAAALKAAPGSMVRITDVSETDSTFDVSKQMMAYRDVGVSGNIQVKFTDVSKNHWAKDFIAELAALEIIEGFPDGTFRPDEQVNRAQFAAMINQAFEKVKVRKTIKFTDVSNRYWASNAINQAYEMGFLTVEGSKFKPKKALSRLEVLLAFARGLNYNVSGSTQTILTAYTDSTMIRSDVRNAIAALTQKGVVVNYPNVSKLNPEKVATRAEVSALLYKALVSTGEVADISSQYAVGQTQEAAELEQVAEISNSGKRKRNCNQGIGNGAEGCDPGNSRPRGGSNDEGGRTPGRRR